MRINTDPSVLKRGAWGQEETKRRFLLAREKGKGGGGDGGRGRMGGFCYLPGKRGGEAVPRGAGAGVVVGAREQVRLALS